MNTNTAEEIKSKLYSDISLDDLVTYCVYLVYTEKKEATFEDIVIKCFKLFPDKFSLVGYSQYPDSARVNKSWLRCRTDFKYISGSVKTGFSVTSKGLFLVEQVQKKLKRPLSEIKEYKRTKSKTRTKEEEGLKEIKQSELFQRYNKEGDGIDISKWEFCDVLFCTLESSPKALRGNLDLLKGYAYKLKRTQVSNFLSCLENKFCDLLEGKNEKEIFEGGMNRRKLKRK